MLRIDSENPKAAWYIPFWVDCWNRLFEVRWQHGIPDLVMLFLPLSCLSPYLFVVGPNINWMHLTRCLPNVKVVLAQSPPLLITWMSCLLVTESAQRRTFHDSSHGPRTTLQRPICLSPRWKNWTTLRFFLGRTTKLMYVCGSLCVHFG